jgi:diadenosine tetraphosphatase ApaH/serine/threonine PP2A family protein phosphatase
VLIALFTDIHANREAFEACLAHARDHAIDRMVFLGDYVGYGADPRFSVDTVRALVQRGAIALLGNHDGAVAGVPQRMNDAAAIAIDWTRKQLDADQISFLAGLPHTAEEDDRLYVHASAADPPRWHYVIDTSSAARSLNATRADITFCGHVHVPALFHLSPTGKVAGFEPRSGVAVRLNPQHRWIAVIGAVGQPRDRDPAACYALYDDSAHTLIYVRVPYDVQAAQRKIRDAGLPSFLSSRLAWGR